MRFRLRLAGGLFLIGIGLLYLYVAVARLQHETGSDAIGWIVLALLFFMMASMLLGTRTAATAPTIESGDMQDDFVEILRSTDLARIHLLRGMLEVNGVEARLQDTEASSVFGGIPGFSTKLLVARSDAFRAKELIDRTGA